MRVCACACGSKGGGGRNSSRLSLFPKEGGEGKQRRSPFTVTIYHHHCHHHHCSLCSPCPPKNPKCYFFFFYIFCSWEAAVWFCILGCADFRFSRNAKRNRTNIGRRLAWLFVFAPLSAGIQRTLNEKRHFVELFFFIPRSRFEVPPFRLLHISLSLGKANAHLRLLLSFPFHASCVT